MVFAVIALALISFSSFSFYFGIAGIAVAALTILDSLRTRYIYSEGSQYPVKFDKSVTEDDIRYITTIDMQGYVGYDVSYQGAQGDEEENDGASADIAAEAAAAAADFATTAAAGGKQLWKKT